MKWKELRDEPCPVARGLSVVGDRWTMLVLRDCFLGVTRFEHFQERLGITRHVLTDRLRKLERDGLLRRKAYVQHPLRHEYQLTKSGKAFYPVLMTLITWANIHVPLEDRPTLRILAQSTGKPVKPSLVDDNTGEPITYDSVRWPDI